MRVQPYPGSTDCSPFLLDAVPDQALRVLDVGCAEGQIGAAVKSRVPNRVVYGIEKDPSAAAQAEWLLDRVFTIDVESESVPLPVGSVDCIVYGNILDQLQDAEAVLRMHRELLAPGGMILCLVPNVQHHSLIRALLTGDFQYGGSALLDPKQRRLYSYSTFIKLLLDAGYLPTAMKPIGGPMPHEFRKALAPVLAEFRLHPARTERHLSASQYIFSAVPYRPATQPDSRPDQVAPFSDMSLTFVACVSDEEQLRANLLSSPCLQAGTPHQVLLKPSCSSAAEGLNQGIAEARHELVICLHQDVYLPRGWDSQFVRAWRQAAQQFGRLGVAGVFGVRLDQTGVQQAGRVMDREWLLDKSTCLPCPIDTLDELLLAVPKNAGLQFDSRLGFHFYGADICLQAQDRGLATVALDAACFHNSRTVGLPSPFAASGEQFARKWAARLPIATTCVIINRRGEMSIS